MTISYGKNTINAVGFKKSSGEQKAKLKSLANYNCVIIEEADEISEEDFIQLDDSLRTVKGDLTIILLLNAPPKSHWIIRRWFNLDPIEYVNDFYIPTLKEEITDTLFIRTSYEDNTTNMDAGTIERYQGYERGNPTHYYNMIKGYVPETIKGKIYSNWQEIDKVPHEARLVRRGLDFGYSVDPSALVAVYEYNGGYILDEELYIKGMSNKRLADTILSLAEPTCLVIADSSEPKSIDEIKSYGVNIIGAVKGADSINHGISYVQAQKISYTSRSKNIKQEYENYSWMSTKDGDTLNTPKDMWNHCFIGSTNISTEKGLVCIKNIKVGDKVLTSKGFNKVIAVHNNGSKQVYKYRLQFDMYNDIILQCTPEHKIKTNKGWVPISQLQSEMMVTLDKNLIIKRTNFTQEKGIFLEAKKECTLKFISFTKKLYQKAIKFTTETKTLGTIQSKILNVLKATLTYLSTLKKNSKTKNLLKDFSLLESLKPKNGTNQRRAHCGIASMGKIHGLTGFIKNLFVKYVQKNTRLDTVVFPNTATITAKLKHCVVEDNWREVVYDITISNNHEYFANGVLVHNCMDSLRYSLTTLKKKEEVIYQYIPEEEPLYGSIGI
jgi:phage terminase large subunit